MNNSGNLDYSRVEIAVEIMCYIHEHLFQPQLGQVGHFSSSNEAPQTLHSVLKTLVLSSVLMLEYYGEKSSG